MSKVMKTMSVIAVLLSFSFGASAKEYLVGFKGNAFKKAQKNQKLLNLSSESSVKVFKNLKMMIIDVASKKDLAALNENANIEFVDSIQNLKAPKKISSSVGTLFSNQKRFVDYPWGILEIDAPAAWAHSKSGQGVKVMVLDSGIDKDHPNISSRFKKGRNLINPRSRKRPYAYFDEGGHGTHVAGTILADGFGSGVIGVAPLADLYVGKVCDEGCPGSAIIAGVEWAIEEKVGVVNMSLGGGFGTASAAAVYKRAEEANVVIVAASGNDARNRISYPSKYDHVLSVGAIDENLMVAEFSNWDSDLDVVAPGVDVVSSLPKGTGRESKLSFEIDGKPVSVDSSAMGESKDGMVDEMPIQYVGLGQPEDFEDVDLTGKIALIKRGEISFNEKVKGAISANASAAIVFNNVNEGVLRGTLGSATDMVAVGISKVDGERILEALMPSEKEEGEAPKVTATLEIAASDFGPQQGTSMASPHVAGVAALIRAANSELDAVEVKNIIRKTVTEPPVDNTNKKYGRGIVNAFKAVQAAVKNND